MPQQRQLTSEQYAAMEPDKVLRTMQIIAGALIASALAFGVAASVIALGQAPDLQPVGQPQVVNHLLTLLANGVVTLNAILSFIVPNIISRFRVNGIGKMMKDGSLTNPKELLGRLLSVAKTRTIVALALLEGGALLALFAVIINKSLDAMAVICISICFMIEHLPTKLKLARWLEAQQQALEL